MNKEALLAVCSALKAVSPHYPGFLPAEMAANITEVEGLALIGLGALKRPPGAQYDVDALVRDLADAHETIERFVEATGIGTTERANLRGRLRVLSDHVIEDSGASEHTKGLSRQAIEFLKGV